MEQRPPERFINRAGLPCKSPEGFRIGTESSNRCSTQRLGSECFSTRSVACLVGLKKLRGGPPAPSLLPGLAAASALANAHRRLRPVDLANEGHEFVRQESVLEVLGGQHQWSRQARRRRANTYSNRATVPAAPPHAKHNASSFQNQGTGLPL